MKRILSKTLPLLWIAGASTLAMALAPDDARVAWRSPEEVPQSAAAACAPMTSLEGYFWDFVEHNGQWPLDAAKWERLSPQKQAEVIDKRCPGAVRAHQASLELKAALQREAAAAGSDARPSASGAAPGDTGNGPSIQDRIASFKDKLGPDSPDVQALEASLKKLQQARAQAAQETASRETAVRTRELEQSAQTSRLNAASDANGTDLQRKQRNDAVYGEGSGKAQAGRAASAGDGASDVGHGEAQAGALASEPKALPKPEAAAPPDPNLTKAEQDYIEKARKDAVFGTGWIAAHDAKLDIESVKAYYQNCYVRRDTIAPCVVCPAKADPSPDGYCKDELLLRKLGEKP